MIISQRRKINGVYVIQGVWGTFVLTFKQGRFQGKKLLSPIL